MPINRMKPSHKLVDTLVKSEWWKDIVELCNNDLFNAQIRNSYINIYYKMNNLLKIRLLKGQVVADSNIKFLPVVRKKNPESEYVIVDLNDNKASIRDEVRLVTHNLLSSKNLDFIKKRIDAYASEEKIAQAKLISYNNTVVDAEVGITGDGKSKQNENERTQMDIVHYDEKKEKLIAIELKVINDARLFSKDMNTQLSKYKKMLRDNQNSLSSAFKNVIETKKRLGLIKQGSPLAKLEGKKLKIEERPLLAVMCYNQETINKYRDIIIENLKKPQVYGVIFFGEKVNFTSRPLKNREIFLGSLPFPLLSP